VSARACPSKRRLWSTLRSSEHVLSANEFLNEYFTKIPVYPLNEIGTESVVREVLRVILGVGGARERERERGGERKSPTESDNGERKRDRKDLTQQELSISYRFF